MKKTPETRNPFEHLLTSILFLLIPLGISFWSVTGTLDQYTELRWLILYGICTLLLAGSFELQFLEWGCFAVLFHWAFSLSVEEESKALFLRSIRFANRVGLLVVGLYLIAQKAGYPWRYFASYSGHFGSLFGHKNFAASFYGIALLIELITFDRSESRIKRAWTISLFLLGLYGFYSAKARGATLGFGMGLLFFLGRRIQFSRRIKWGFSAILVISGFYVAAVVSYKGLENGSNTRDLRIARWLNTAAMMVEHPLGIGPGHYEFDYLFYTKRVRPDVEIDGRFVSKTPHNQPLQIGIDYGIPALFFWVLLTGWILRLAFKSKSD